MKRRHLLGVPGTLLLAYLASNCRANPSEATPPAPSTATASPPAVSGAGASGDLQPKPMDPCDGVLPTSKDICNVTAKQEQSVVAPTVKSACDFAVKFRKKHSAMFPSNLPPLNCSDS